MESERYITRNLNTAKPVLSTACLPRVSGAIVCGRHVRVVLCVFVSTASLASVQSIQRVVNGSYLLSL